MVFFYDANGVLLNNSPERVFQGSNKANTIYFICPTAPSNIVNVAFKLPNGESTSQHIMTLTEDTGLTGVFDKNGKIFAMWEYQIPSAVTAYKGNVTIQFYVTANDGIVISTESAVFMVEKGVSNIEPEQGDTYQEVLNQIIALYNMYEDFIGFGDYNNILNTPIINANLSDIVATPNTYYRHTGETTSAYINNRIYYYDGTFFSLVGGHYIEVQDTLIGG